MLFNAGGRLHRWDGSCGLMPAVSGWSMWVDASSLRMVQAQRCRQSLSVPAGTHRQTNPTIISIFPVWWKRNRI